MKHVMVDLETLGLSVDAVILSVGAVKFDLEGDAPSDDGFYGSISIDSNLDAGRRVDEDTLLWWLKQPAAAQQVFHEEKQGLAAVLLELSDWLDEDDWVVWSKGPSFDVAMLEHAYKQACIAVPWKFWNTRCVRTYMALPGAKGIVGPTLGVKHNALSDAYEQAQTVQLIHRALFGTGAAQGKKATAK